MIRVFHRLEEATPDPRGCAVAIGNFDGCHLGHQRLLQGMRDYAGRHNLTPAVLTFYPHPVEVINPSKRRARLMTTSEKLAALESLGVELVLVEPFDIQMAALPPEVFFERYLHCGLRARSVHVGYNFMFGRGRAGNTESLRALCEANGMHLEAMPAFELDGERVSSSSIREAIQAGDCLAASRLLGKPYALTGQVSHGDARGKSLGFPTANLHCAEEKLLPKNGVYVTRARWQKQVFNSVTNVGVRPTFHEGETRPVVEVHLLDFHLPLYDEFVRLEFFERIRDEKKFSSVDDLKAQIQKDIAAARTSASIN